MKVLDKNDQVKIKFDINLLDLSFLCEELYTTSIHFYPIVIFEFMNGYYTTSGIKEKNNFLMNDNIRNNENILKIGNYSSCPAEDIHKEEFLKGFLETNKDNNNNNPPSKSVILKKNLAEKEEQNTNNSNVRMSVRPSIDSKQNMKLGFKEKKINCYKFNDYINVYIEKIIFFRDYVMKEKKVDLNNEQFEKCETIRENYKRRERMTEVKKLIEYYQNKREEIKKLKKKLQTIVSNKKTILSNLRKKIDSCKEKCEKLEQSNKKSISLVVQNKIIYNSFLNKKMVELCFFFFNKKIKNLYFIPDFLKINIKNDNESTKKRFEYYNSNKKKISSMMGYITQLMIYFSKCFDVPMPYPLCLNGSKCSVVRGKKDKEKDFLPLYCDLKREDKYGNFETGLNYLKNDFNEIINFCSMFPQIISENTYNKIYKENEDNVFFYFFIKFNHCLQEFIKNIQKKFDI